MSTSGQASGWQIFRTKRREGGTGYDETGERESGQGYSLLRGVRRRRGKGELKLPWEQVVSTDMSWYRIDRRAGWRWLGHRHLRSHGLFFALGGVKGSRC